MESPPGALALIVALAAGEQAFWAVALFVGLRRGELRALRWSDVVLAAGAVITVTRTWENDAVSGVGFRVDFALADACGSPGSRLCGRAVASSRSFASSGPLKVC